ncbi:MAG: zinc-binding dehydrogenase [Burkholderiales bacterium]|nr:zinc-binding dehydrogenase [Anaerolineae bacterium]
MAQFPAPRTGEVIIRARYLAINSGFTTGEVAGEVVDVGAGVGNYAEQDTLLALNVEYSSISDSGGYFAAEAIRTIPIANATPEIVALAGSGITASIVLNEVAYNAFGNSQLVLITSAAQGVGHIAVQLAKLAEQRVIGLYKTDEQQKLLLELGCDTVVHNADTAKLPNNIDILFETDGQRCDDCVSHLAMNGQRITVVPQTTNTANEFWLPAYYREYGPRHLTQLYELHRAGTIRVMIDPMPFIGAKSITDALEYVKRGENIGQVVVRFD